MEKTIFLKKEEAYYDLKHIIQLAYLFYVFV